jgi:hypothetical protein
MPIDLDKIQESPHLLDILIQMEDVLDSLDIYVFKNWYRGEVVEGPVVRRYWLDMTLKYAKDKMPDPKAAYRLLKHGVRVDFWQATMNDGSYTEISNQTEEQAEEEDKGESVWMVRISIPRRLITQMSAEEMDMYDDDVDVDDVEDAKDTGIDDESAYKSEDMPGMEDAPPGGEELPPQGGGF